MKVAITWDETLAQHERMTFTAENWRWRPDARPGAAMWAQREVGADGVSRPTVLWWVCPCGCGSLGSVFLNRGGGWQWDGDEAAPSLTPSLQKLTPCQWHGYLTKGVFESC